MTDHEPLEALTCGAKLKELDRRYGDAHAQLLDARSPPDAGRPTVDSLFRDLMALRREMLKLESAEVERISAKYRRVRQVGA